MLYDYLLSPIKFLFVYNLKSESSLVTPSFHLKFQPVNPDVLRAYHIFNISNFMSFHQCDYQPNNTDFLEKIFRHKCPLNIGIHKN